MLKVALELHLRTLWCLPHQNAVPPLVNEDDKAHYARRFTNEGQVKTSVTASLDQHSISIIEARGRVEALLRQLPEGSIISKNIGRIGEGHLLSMFRTVATLGLQRWAPDVLSGDPDSMYNLLHEHLALTTFEQVASGFGYAHMAVNMALIHDFPLMRKIYRSFVYSYMHGLAKLESKTPGGVEKGKLMGNVWKRRAEVCPLLYFRPILIRAISFLMAELLSSRT